MRAVALPPGSITLQFRTLVSALGSIGIATHVQLRPWLPVMIELDHFAVTIGVFGRPPE